MKIQLSDHFTYSKLFRFTLPSILMMVLTSIYCVVDGYFVSNFAGKTAFAALNLIMPFVMILGGTGFMVGTGGTALVAKVLGMGDRQRANRYFSMLIYFTLLSGALLSILGVVFTPQVAAFLGASADMMHDCVLYGRIINGFTMLYMLQNVFQSFFVAAEKPGLGLAVTTAAGITNMVLDALFVGVFRWGVAGAAVATGLSQCIGGLFPLIYFLRPNSSLLRLTAAKLEINPLLQACGNGASELMSNISGSLVGMIYNFQLMKYIGENGISAYGVLMYVQLFFIAVFIGYSIGCAPVVSYHYGAGNSAELKSILKKSALLMSIFGLAMCAAAYLLAAPLARLFVGYDAELFDLTAHAFRLYSLSFLLAGLNIFASSFFTALNNGAVSAAISFLRTMLFQTSMALILPLVLGVDGIWWAITTAEVCAFVLSASFIFAKRKKYDYI